MKRECCQEDVLFGFSFGVKGTKKNNFLRSWKMNSSDFRLLFYKVPPPW